MNDPIQYYCPLCGALQDALAVHCTHCGSPLCHSDEERLQRVRQLLIAPQEPFSKCCESPEEEPSVPTNEDASSLDTVEEISSTEKVRPPIGLAALLRSLCRAPVLIPFVGGVLLILFFIVGIPLFRRAVLGYQATPEALVDGLNLALQEQDDELFRGLISADASQETIRVPKSSVTFQVVDVIYGEHGKTAVLLLKITDPVDRPIWSSLYSGADPISSIVVKEDGRWCFPDSRLLYYGSYTY